MTRLLIIGAGRSSSALIDYLLAHASGSNWQITVADMDAKLASEKVGGHAHGQALAFDIKNKEERQQLIKAHDFVISMLPAFMHGDVARDCVAFGKHMATASYVSADMRALDAEAKEKGLLLLNECGLDPGIDHASAMKVIDEIRRQGGAVNVFKSYCGGLVAPESNDNPWGYKFSWNPRNVVLAGQGTAQYLQDGKLRFLPYNRLFTQTEKIVVEGHGSFDAYANRDSLNYTSVYGLEGARTMLRGTLRQSGYCNAWNVFVKLGLTDDTSQIASTAGMSYAALVEAFLPPGQGGLKQRLADFAGHCWNADTEKMFDYLEILTEKAIAPASGSPAQLLQALLEEKWLLKDGDKDMIVMQHSFEYTAANGKSGKVTSSLVVNGTDHRHTAMAKTVGLPLAITVKNFLEGKFKLAGVQIPVKQEIYVSLLAELETLGIVFTESWNA